MASRDLTGEKRELARAFAAILLDVRRQRAWAANLGIPPSLTALAEDPAVTRSATLAASVHAMAHDVTITMDDDLKKRWTALKTPLEKALQPNRNIESGVKQLERASHEKSAGAKTPTL